VKIALAGVALFFLFSIESVSAGGYPTPTAPAPAQIWCQSENAAIRVAKANPENPNVFEALEAEATCGRFTQHLYPNCTELFGTHIDVDGIPGAYRIVCRKSEGIPATIVLDTLFGLH
jgi:hypothetical protein